MTRRASTRGAGRISKRADVSTALSRHARGAHRDELSQHAGNPERWRTTPSRRTRKQFPKNLHAVRPAEKFSKPALICLQDASQQANFICQRIEELQEEGIDLNEIAVLYRAHFHSMELQMEMTRRQMPFELLSGLRFFEQAHVKDVAAFLKFALNPEGRVGVQAHRGLMPGVGERTGDKLWQKLQGGAEFASLEPPAKAAAPWKQWVETHKQITAQDTIRAPRLGANPDRGRRDLRGLHEDEVPELPVAAGGSRAAPGLRAEFRADGGFPRAARADDERRWRSEAGQRRDSASRAMCAPEHDSPGEGARVEESSSSLCCATGCFPPKRSVETLEGEEEERRLFYVAVTRACDELYLTYPLMRATASFDDRWQEPSRFITELSREGW